MSHSRHFKGEYNSVFFSAGEEHALSALLDSVFLKFRSFQLLSETFTDEEEPESFLEFAIDKESRLTVCIRARIGGQTRNRLFELNLDVNSRAELEAVMPRLVQIASLLRYGPQVLDDPEMGAGLLARLQECWKPLYFPPKEDHLQAQAQVPGNTVGELMKHYIMQTTSLVKDNFPRAAMQEMLVGTWDHYETKHRCDGSWWLSKPFFLHEHAMGWSGTATQLEAALDRLHRKDYLEKIQRSGIDYYRPARRTVYPERIDFLGYLLVRSLLEDTRETVNFYPFSAIVRALKQLIAAKLLVPVRDKRGHYRLNTGDWILQAGDLPIAGTSLTLRPESSIEVPNLQETLADTFESCLPFKQTRGQIANHESRSVAIGGQIESLRAQIQTLEQERREEDATIRALRADLF